MQTILNRTFMAAISAEPKRTVVKKVEQRVLANACLIDEEQDDGSMKSCDGESEIRGLCGKHHQQFLRDMAEMPAEDRIEFEKRQIEDGLILGSHAVRKIRRRSPFSRG